MSFIRILVLIVWILIGTVSAYSTNSVDDKLDGTWCMEPDPSVLLVIKDNAYSFIGEGKAYDSIVGYFGEKEGKIDLSKVFAGGDTYQADNFVIHVDEKGTLILTKEVYTSFCYRFRKK